MRDEQKPDLAAVGHADELLTNFLKALMSIRLVASKLNGIDKTIDSIRDKKRPSCVSVYALTAGSALGASRYRVASAASAPREPIGRSGPDVLSRAV